MRPSAAKVRTIIWATGYGSDVRWVDPTTYDEYGNPIHVRGLTETPGLYFVGLPWLPTLKSSLLSGVGDDAKYIVADIMDRSNRVTISP